MTVMVALLRGINVAGRGRLPMADLRAVATGLGCDAVATYIQSGNLVLSTTDRAATVAEDLAAAIAVGNDLYLWLPNGVGRSRLATDIGRQKGGVGTMRSWRTVTALLAMADEAAG